MSERELHPLSRDEHKAMARYVANIRKQLQEVSELFNSRCGQESSLADLSAKALVFATLLEHEMRFTEEQEEAIPAPNDPENRGRSAISVIHNK